MAHQPGLVGLAVHVQQQAVVAGVEQREIALAHLDLLGVDGAHQVVIADRAGVHAEGGLKVDHHPAPLHPGRGQRLDAQRAGVHRAILGRADQMFVGAIAVVIDLFGHAIAVGIEQAAVVGQRIPLRRILRMEHDVIVAGDLAAAIPHVVVLADMLVAGAEQAGWRAEGHHLAAGVIQRQAEAEGDAFADLAHAGKAAFGGEPVHPADLVVGPEIAPVRAIRPVYPTWHFRLPVVVARRWAGWRGAMARAAAP